MRERENGGQREGRKEIAMEGDELDIQGERERRGKSNDGRRREKMEDMKVYGRKEEYKRAREDG